MKPDYKNWLPKGMLIAVCAAAAVFGVLLAVFGLSNLLTGTAKTVTVVILAVLFLLTLIYALFCINLYTAFSYQGKRQLARRIIDKVSDYVTLPEGGLGLDVGCGSGALTIACAKKNPKAKMIGLDRWGAEYASFNKPLCQRNAEIEGVKNRASFQQGDACKLDFPDETFDAVTSNYCYHNIPSTDRQAIILETMRVLKKGGTFAIHDEFTRSKYGDTQQLLQKLKDLGFEKAELLDTSNGLILSRREAGPLCLIGSGLLVGRK